MTIPFNPVPDTIIPPEWVDYSWDNPETWDPMLAWQRHPHLYCGLNDAPFAWDEINGPGYNEPVWPNVFTATEVFSPTVIDVYDLEYFAHPDLVVRGEKTNIVVPRECRTVVVRR